MAALFYVRLRATKTVDEKATETFFGAGQIAAAVHRAENVVLWNLLVECRDEPLESFIADCGVDFVFFHSFIVPKVWTEARRRALDRGRGRSASAR